MGKKPVNKPIPRCVLVTLATAVPALVYIIRFVTMVGVTNDASGNLYAVGGPQQQQQLQPATSEEDLQRRRQHGICGPVAPAAFVATHNATCEQLLASTKAAPQCGGGGGDPDKEYGMLVTGVSGNLPDATLAWFRTYRISLSRDNAPPTPPYGSVSWVLAFSDWEQYPSFAKIPSMAVSCAVPPPLPHSPTS